MSRCRLTAAIQTLYKIMKLPHSKLQKCEFVRACAHSRGLYGCESSPVDESLLRTYTSLVLKTIGTTNQMHC
eukprot:11036893-Karenia_brevis.AAC.1